MRLLALDDLKMDDLNLPERPLVTDRSSSREWSVRHRQGLTRSTFFGGQIEPARWNIVFKCDDIDARDALLAVLGDDVADERRLLAMRDDVAQTRVLAFAAPVKIVQHNELDFTVDFDSVDSVWTSEESKITSKTYTSTLDPVMHLTVPGNMPTWPRIIMTPTAQRTTASTTAGWRYRRRYTIANTSDVDWFRLPLRISLGDTTPLTTTKAQADGDDVRIVINGREQQRTLVTWDTAASYVWFVLDHLPAGESQVVEVWYGNSAATLPPTLAYPNLPPFTLASSSNGTWVYPTNLVAGEGLYSLSDPTPGAVADFTVPAAWKPVLTLANPENPDHHAQYLPRIVNPTHASAVFSAVRVPGNFESFANLENPYDGMGFYHPLGILTAAVGLQFANGNGIGAFVVLRRESAAANWAVVYAYSVTQPAYVALGPGPQTINARNMAYAIWPANGWMIDPDAGGIVVAAYMDTTTTITIDTTDLSITGGTEEEIYEIATEIRMGGGDQWIPPYRSLLIGNARGATGGDIPRVAVRLDEMLIVDADEQTCDVWESPLSLPSPDVSPSRIERVSAHAVRPIAAWFSDDAHEEGPSNEWLMLTPARTTVPNGDFNVDLRGWQADASDAGFTASRVHVPGFGGRQLGALLVQITANTSASNAMLRTVSNANLSINGRPTIGVAAWMRTNNVNLVPYLYLTFRNAAGDNIFTSEQATWPPVVNTPMRRSFAERVPLYAVSYEIGVGVRSLTTGNIGQVMFDDVTTNDNDLHVYDANVGTLLVDVLARGRWL